MCIAFIAKRYTFVLIKVTRVHVVAAVFRLALHLEILLNAGLYF